MDVNLNIKPDSYALFQIRGMQSLGLWPLDTKNRFKLLCFYLYSLTFIILIAIASITQIIQICFVPNLEEMSSTVDTATLNISGLYKMLYYIIYHNHFKSLIRTVDTYFIEQAIWDKKFKMSEYLKNSKRYTQLYIASAVCVMIFWFFAPIIDMNFFATKNSMQEKGLRLNETILLNNHKFNKSIETENSGTYKMIYENKTKINIYKDYISISDKTHEEFENNQNSGIELINKHRRFPLNCWFPFDIKWSPLYEIVYVLEMSSLSFASLAYIITDSFFFMIMYMVCGQLEICKISLLSMRKLEEKFRKKMMYFEINTDNQANNHKSSPDLLAQQILTLNTESEYLELEKNMYSVLTFCIQHHKMLLELLQDLEVLFRPLILIDFLHAILSLSFAMLETSISVQIVEYIKCLMFVAVCILHQFLNNYFSELIIQKQTSICESAYDTPWEDRSKAFKHTIQVMMIRARNPVLLNGWKMYFLCLDTFKQFMSTLISYFMVLRQLQSDTRN